MIMAPPVIGWVKVYFAESNPLREMLEELLFYLQCYWVFLLL
jgi:hypothetical protein